MKIVVFENIMTPGGHEVDFDRILVEELQLRGHEIIFYVPENFQFQFDYKVPVKKISGDSVSYTNSTGLRKIFASAKREINRQRWYKQLSNSQADFDALIIPTSTYRYLRALNHSVLKNISKPLIFILHGVNPAEAPKLLREADKLSKNKNIKIVVLTLAENIFGQRRDNIFTIYPPTYIARDLKLQTKIPSDTLTVGFFGQYRREKKLRDLLEVFVNENYSRKVQLTIQGSTMHKEDSADFEEIIKQYKNFSGLKFINRGLFGEDWQQAISNVDALLMPYSAPRYRYHWSGMLFTAIGYQKPVIVSDEMNPEVFEMYRIGETFQSGNLESLRIALKNFIDDFDKNFPTYEKNLRAASENFSPSKFAERLEKFFK